MRAPLAGLWLLSLLAVSGCLGVADLVDAEAAPRSVQPLADAGTVPPAPDAGLEVPPVDGGVDAGTPEVDPCEGVRCEHGRCERSGGAASCQCDPGYHLAAGACVADDPCAAVTCGANARCQAGACSCLDGFEGDPASGCAASSTAEEDAVRAQLVAIATAELGECEDATPKVYMTWQPGLWCYDFVAWVYSQASRPLPSPIYLPEIRIGSQPTGWRPRPGDLIKYTYQHYGMVESVSADGQHLTTLEGNVSSCVTRRSATVASLEFVGSLASAF